MMYQTLLQDKYQVKHETVKMYNYNVNLHYYIAVDIESVGCDAFIDSIELCPLTQYTKKLSDHIDKECLRLEALWSQV